MLRGTHPSRTITFTPVVAHLTPLPAGALVGKLLVKPSSWHGSVAITGLDAEGFSLASDLSLYTTRPLPPGDYIFIVSATP